MRKHLIISHGGFAKGIQNTLDLFLGNDNPFEAISAYMDDTSVEDQIEAFMSTINDEDELIVLSDLMGGSVNQKMIPYLKREKTFIIAGFNFPLLLQLSVMPTDEPLTIEVIHSLIENSKEAMVLVNEVFSNVTMNGGDE